MYFAEPEAIAELSDDEARVHEDDPRGCALVKLWPVAREESVEHRRGYCEACPINTGAWPKTTRLYRVAERHMAEVEAGLSPDPAGYTDEEREAIMVVWSERQRLRAEDARQRRREAESRQR